MVSPHPPSGSRVCRSWLERCEGEAKGPRRRAHQAKATRNFARPTAGSLRHYEGKVSSQTSCLMTIIIAILLVNAIFAPHGIIARTTTTTTTTVAVAPCFLLARRSTARPTRSPSNMESSWFWGKADKARDRGAALPWVGGLPCFEAEGKPAAERRRRRSASGQQGSPCLRRAQRSPRGAGTSGLWPGAAALSGWAAAERSRA